MTKRKKAAFIVFLCLILVAGVTVLVLGLSGEFRSTDQRLRDAVSDLEKSNATYQRGR
jgi:hypothetical protein